MANVMVKIDRDACVVCEQCWQICPDVFVQNQTDSWSQIVPQYQVNSDPASGAVPEDLKDKVQEAADSCPVTIIHVGESMEKAA